MPELERLRADHAPAVLAFELANRAWFAASVTDRGDAYFAEFDERFDALLAEQEAGVCAFYVLVGEDGAVLGRFNLYDLKDGVATVGYRVAHHVSGRGVATAAVRELCAVAAIAHGLHTLRAATASRNVASQRVLTRAGFLPTGPADPAELGGKPGFWFQRSRLSSGVDLSRVHGGYANRMYRLDTDQGSYAIKELNLLDRRSVYRAADVFRFERAAFEAGIPMPEPISATDGTLVHRWAEGEKIPEAPVPPAYAHEIGEILARLHKLDVPWSPAPADEPAARDWPELAARARATGQPWAGELTGTFLEIADFVDTCARPGPVVLTHRDIQPWNLLTHEGRPVLLDWELSGLLDLSGELGSTALSLAKGPGFDDIEPAVFHAVLDGYKAGGGVLPPWGPSWFVYLIGGWLGHVRWNIERCLAGAEAGSGPDLALSQEVAGNGVRGLPDLFARLPDLEDLLA